MSKSDKPDLIFAGPWVMAQIREQWAWLRYTRSREYMRAYRRHWNLEGPSVAPGSPTDALYRRGLGW